MAEDPNKKPIESLLQAYAKKRRDDAGQPLDVHPATRRMLQGEVKRVHGSGAASAGKPRFHLWPRLALSGFAISVLATVSLIWVQFFKDTSPRQESAVSERTPPVPALLEAQPLAADAKEMLGRSDAPVQSATAAGDSEVRLQPAPARRLASARSRDLQEESKESVAAGRELSDVNNVTRSLNRQAPASPAASTPSTTASASGGLGGGAGAADRGLARGVNIPTEQREGDELKLAELGAGAARPLDAIQPKSELAYGVHPAEARSYSFFAVPPFVTNSAGANVGIVALNANLGTIDAYAYFKQGVVTQQFVQVNTRARLRENFQSPPVPPVLNSFRFVQKGDELQVVDADGSTYTGKFVREPAALVVTEALGETERLNRQAGRFVEAPSRAAKAAAAPAVAAVANNVHFRVEGTNQTINKRVLFEGRVVSSVSASNAPGQAAPAGVAFGDGAQIRGEAQAGLSNLAIEGSATIGGREKLRINAIPAQPPPR